MVDAADPGSDHGFLAVLAHLERRDQASAGTPMGYANQSPETQAWLTRIVAGLIDQNPAFQGGADTPYTYTTGGGLMALSAWLRTGGPDEVGAVVPVRTAIESGVISLLALHPRPDVGWSYSLPGGDLSTSHFAVNGLAAVLDGFGDDDGTVQAAVSDALVFVEANRTPDGGLSYQGGAAEASSSMTASGAWLLRLGGAEPGDESVQDALAWLRQRPTWEHSGGFAPTSQAYFMWSMTKLMLAVAEPGRAGLSATDFGMLDPANTDWPDVPAGPHLDIAARILPAQNEVGEFTGPPFNGQGWTPISTQAFALLALERSTGGVWRFEAARGNTPPQCADGIDNDEDGLADHPQDPDCVFACQWSERPQPACRNALDDDGDGLVDADDPACAWSDAPTEADTQCSNRIDDDGDGAVDAWEDRGCTGSDDDDETDPLDGVGQPACADDGDNDADGVADYPADADCVAPFQTVEGPPVCPGGPVVTILPGATFVRGDTRGAGSDLRADCGGLVAEDLVYALVVDRPQIIRFSTLNEETDYDVLLYVMEDCQVPESELACADDLGALEQRAMLTVNFTTPGVYALVVDGKVGRGSFRVDFERIYAAPTCVNGRDDDGDGLVDLVDRGCTGPWDSSEVDEGAMLPACDNARDDEGDGLVDFPRDPGCEGAGDTDETDPDAPAACGNGRDDDGDGFVDFPVDPGCTAASDDSEGSAAGACSDHRDNDADGWVDYPFDPGCVSAGADREDGPAVGPCVERFPSAPGCESAADPDATAPAVAPECANGADDDGDGLIDFPDDTACDFAADDEAGAMLAGNACSNGRDDDGDGLTDYPLEPGCTHRGDPDETDPPLAPTCTNGVDDDRDGRTDHPFDPGCVSAADPDEADDARTTCSNGQDDDGDGRADFPLDPGCASAVDTDETDLRDTGACADGEDNDEDGRTDFPDDAACRFAADDSEAGEPVRARCEDGADNDWDGLTDAFDPGCAEFGDDDETDPPVVPLCADGRDNDRDGRVDFPLDPGCATGGDPSEDQSCRPEVVAELLPARGAVAGDTTGGADLYAARCGGRESPERVFRYTLAASADLTFSVDDPATDFPAALYVRRDCEAAASTVACIGASAEQPGTVTLPAAEPGDYFVFVDGGGPLRLVSSGGPLDFPPSPDGFVAEPDVFANGWNDGGRDAFDGFGTTFVTVPGVEERQLDVSLGERQVQIGGFALRIVSGFPAPNVWRVELLPVVAGDSTPVTVRIGSLAGIGGNMGCDRDCLEEAGYDLDGRRLRHFVSTDESDPDTVQMLVPSDPEAWGAVTYESLDDDVQITAPNVTLPVTLYVALTDGDLGQAAAALAADLVSEGGGQENAGRFRLTATETPVR
jgi:hypothetical protein